MNGVSLGLTDAGEGPAILFIHGYPLSRALWRHQVGQLAGWRSIAPDLRGMGASDAPDIGYSMATYAADLIALLDALAIDRAVLCGLSMGGYVAFEFLRQARARVRGLVLMATRAEADSAETRANREAAMRLARERGAAAVAETMVPRMLAPASLAACPEVVEEIRRLMAATPVAGVVGALSAMRDRPDSTPDLEGLGGLPVLVLAGEGDQLIPPGVMKRMSEQIPGSTFRLVEGAGHLIPLEQPDAVTRAIQGFLTNLG